MCRIQGIMELKTCVTLFEFCRERFLLELLEFCLSSARRPAYGELDGEPLGEESPLPRRVFPKLRGNVLDLCTPIGCFILIGLLVTESHDNLTVLVLKMFGNVHKHNKYIKLTFYKVKKNSQNKALTLRHKS